MPQRHKPMGYTAKQFFRFVEGNYDTTTVNTIKERMALRGEKLVHALQVTWSEHNWFPGMTAFDGTGTRLILSGYMLTIKDSKGDKRYVRFDAYIQELVDFTKARLEKASKKTRSNAPSSEPKKEAQRLRQALGENQRSSTKASEET